MDIGGTVDAMGLASKAMETCNETRFNSSTIVPLIWFRGDRRSNKQLWCVLMGEGSKIC